MSPRRPLADGRPAPLAPLVGLGSLPPPGWRSLPFHPPKTQVISLTALAFAPDGRLVLPADAAVSDRLPHASAAPGERFETALAELLAEQVRATPRQADYLGCRRLPNATAVADRAPTYATFWWVRVSLQPSCRRRLVAPARLATAARDWPATERHALGLAARRQAVAWFAAGVEAGPAEEALVWLGDRG